MKRNIHQLKLSLGQLDQRRIHIGLAVLTLVLLVLGSGAPAGGGCC